MRRLRVQILVLVAIALAVSAQAHAAITRIAGPTNLYFEDRAFVRYDVAFDTANRVYLLVWGTQLTGPVNGLFLNESGAPVGPIFAVSGGAQQSGWARVIYAAQQGKFLVSYTKILAVNAHQKLARFVTYAGSSPGTLGAEIPLDSWAGNAGTETGLAYSAPSGRFFVTWWRYNGAFPASFVATLDSNGNVLGSYLMTNPADGQSDPEIACDPTSRRCLVVGWSWGVFNGGRTAIWSRFLDDTTGAPQGSDSVYLPATGYLEEPTLAFSTAGSRYVVGYTGGGQIVGNTVDASTGTSSAAYPLLATSAGTASLDGGGYGFPSLVYNPGTQTFVLSATPWMGYPAAQEIDSAGTPIAGARDFVPDVGGPNGYDLRNKYTKPAANPVSKQFLLVDNHYFKTFRVSLYSTGGTVSPPPPPPPPPPTPCSSSSLSVDSNVGLGSPASTVSIEVSVPASCAWTAASNDSWMQVTKTSGSGPGNVAINVLRNTARTARRGTLAIAGQSIVVQQAGYNPASTHDMTGDGYSDFLWQYGPTGELALWTVQSVNVVSRQSLLSGIDLSWKVVGTGDLDGNGRADIVWQNTDGTVAGWLWTQEGYAAGAGYITPRDVAPDWKVRAVGDLDGDGKADIVWQHTDGWLGVWLMDGLRARSTVFLSVARQTDQNWAIVGAGDINNDGKADIVWQHQATGQLGAWLMNGAQAISMRYLSLFTSDLNWRVVGVGDVEGNGFADLIWENMATGQVALWTLDGFNVQYTRLIYDNGVPSIVDLNWRMVGPG